MKFVVSSALLAARLATVGRVIVQKNNIPILDCFRFDIRGGKLSIMASDGDSTLTSELELNESDGEALFAVNAKTLQDAIKEIPEQPLEFYLNTDTLELVVDYQNGQYKLLAQAADEYPTAPEGEGPMATISLSTHCLLGCLSRALTAAANDELRPQLNTVCLSARKGELTLVGTNGNQLAMTRLKMEGQEVEHDFLLGTRPAGLLRNMLAKEEGSASLALGNSRAFIATQNYSLNCRLVDGRYPNFRGVIPQGNPYVVHLNRAALISVMRRILVFANPATSVARFRLENNTLNLSSQDLDYGKSAEESMLCDYSGTPMRIAFKGVTLQDLVQNLECENVIFEMADPSRAALILPEQNEEGEEVVMLMMPSVFND